MVDDKGVENYIHKVNEIVNAIRSVGGKIKEDDVAKNILLTLPKPYKAKKCSIEEYHDLHKYAIDQLLGSISTYEISEMEDIKKERKQVAINVSNIAKDEQKASENMDEIKAKFVRRLKRGIEKYKGKLPLK